MELKDNIKAARESQGMTISELSKKVGISAQSLTKYESGEIERVSIYNLKRIANALNTTVEKLKSTSAEESIIVKTDNVVLAHVDEQEQVDEKEQVAESINIDINKSEEEVFMILYNNLNSVVKKRVNERILDEIIKDKDE